MIAKQNEYVRVMHAAWTQRPLQRNKAGSDNYTHFASSRSIAERHAQCELLDDLEPRGLMSGFHLDAFDVKLPHATMLLL